MAVDNSGGNYDGHIYVSWTDFSVGNAQQIRFAYSTDHGQTFSNYTILAQATGASEEEYVKLMPESEPPEIPDNFQSNFVQGSVPVVGPNGEVYVVWLHRISSSTGYIKLRKSTNGGQSFGSTINVTPSGFEPVWVYLHGSADARTMPTIAVDPTNGYVYIAYIAWSGSATNIYFTRSTNGGVSWSSPTTVTKYTENYQFFPWLTVDPLGYISLIYYHGYTQGATKLIDVYVAESFDSGENFAGSDLKINDTPSSPQYAAWTHHYIGITSRLGGGIFPVWSDYRNDNADTYFSPANILTHIAYFNQSSVYTATYSNSARNQVKGASYLHEVFSSGGEIFYRRSSDGGQHFNVTERITTGNGNNQRACITCYTWTPSEIEFTTLAAVWERKISTYQYEVWYSSSDAQTIDWSSPQKLADVTISSLQSGALPVISSLEYQVANKIGYSSPRSYRRAFKSRFGMLPSKYKEIINSQIYCISEYKHELLEKLWCNVTK